MNQGAPDPSCHLENPECPEVPNQVGGQNPISLCLGHLHFIPFRVPAQLPMTKDLDLPPSDMAMLHNTI